MEALYAKVIENTPCRILFTDWDYLLLVRHEWYEFDRSFRVNDLLEFEYGLALIVLKKQLLVIIFVFGCLDALEKPRSIKIVFRKLLRFGEAYF